jgi:hypothetical protein
MKTLVAIGLAVAVAAGIAAAGAHDERFNQGRNSAGAQPWQVDRCYRVFPANRDTFYTFKVLEAPTNGWVRVQAVPALPTVPGGAQPVTQWLNSQSAFLVQDWSCPE